VAHTIVSVLEETAFELGVSIATAEFELMLILLERGSLKTDDLHARSRLSRAGFFHVMNRLRYRGSIECVPSETDRRSKAWRLSPRAAELVMANLITFRGTPLGTSDQPVKDGQVLVGDNFDRLHLRDGQIRLPHLTCEFQILLYLMFNPGATSADIARHVTSSETRCYAALRTLISMNLVLHERTDDDRRLKRHRLPGWVVAAMERTSLKAAEWVLAMQRQYQAVPASDGGSVVFAKPGMLRGS